MSIARLTPLEPWIAAKIGTTLPLDRSALEAWQLARLQATVGLARRHSPFYRERLAGAPEVVTSLAELQLLPFTTAADLRANPLRLVCVSQDAIARIVTLTSSGTTGTPKRVAFTRADQELTLDFFQVGMRTFTAPGDRVLIMLPGPTPGSVGDLLVTALERMGAAGLLHDPLAQPATTARAIAASGASVLVATPSQAILLARHPDAAGLRLRSVLLTTDHVPRAVVAAVEAAWGCIVYNHYGMTETGLGGGVECQARRGYHLREADLLFEVVDPTCGTPLPDGQSGELVFTTLTRAGMPLIRYRTGDAGRFLPGACPCGATLRTLERVTHRLAGRMELGGATLTMADLDEALFPLAAVLGFSATLTRGSRDRLTVDLTVTPGAAAYQAQAAAALAELQPIGAALAADWLDLVIEQHPFDPAQDIALHKRVIVEHKCVDRSPTLPHG